MRPSDDLYLLARSLSKSEKRYLRLTISVQQGETDYMKLLDAIWRQPVPDEKELLKQFAGQAFINRLPAVKNYLYHLILKSLRTYYAGQSIDVSLREDLHNVILLFQRQLYGQALKMLNRAKKKAVKYERFLICLEIMRWERKIANRITDVNVIRKQVKTMYQEIERTITAYSNLCYFENLSFTIRLIDLEKGKRVTKQDLKILEKIMADPVLKSEDRALSLEATYSFHQIHAESCFFRNDVEGYFTWCKKIVLFLESHPEFIEQDVARLMAQYNNLMIAQLRLNKLNEYVETLDKLKKLPLQFGSVMNNELLARNYLTIRKKELILYIYTAEFEKAVQLAESDKEELFEHLKVNSHYYAIFYPLIVVAHFGSENFSYAMQLLTRLLNDMPESGMGSFGYNPYVYRILQLIIHFELKNYDILPYMIRSVYSFLYKNKKMFAFEQVIMDFIRKKLIHTLTRKELLEAFSELRNELIKLQADPFEKRVFEYFDFISWVDSKIENKPFAEIIKRKLDCAVSPI